MSTRVRMTRSRFIFKSYVHTRRWCAMYLLSNRIQKTPTRKTKSSREQESSGDKLVTRSGVLHETKKVCVEHLASCCTVFYPRGQDRCCSDFPSQTYLRAQLSPMHAVQKPSLVSLVLLPLPDIPLLPCALILFVSFSLQHVILSCS